MPRGTKSILGLSHKFIPVPHHTPYDIDAYLSRFERDVHLKVWFAQNPLDNKPPKLYVKSEWRPPSIPVEVDRRLYAFFRSIRSLFRKKKGRNNLLPFQQKLMAKLRRQAKFMIAKTDKGLGPCAIEYTRYIQDVLVHLADPGTYQTLTRAAAEAEARRICRDIYSWTFKYRKSLDEHETKYIRKKTDDSAEDPFGYFYLMYKVHKSPLKTRPVVSDCGSCTYALAKWVDIQLQPIVQELPFYFRDSFDLKELILNPAIVPARSRVWASDAVGMYINIPTDPALVEIAAYLRDPETQKQFPHFKAEMLIAALEIVMQNSLIKCGDHFVKQISGTAMGKPCAPPWANLYQALHELKFRNDWIAQVPIYIRFIDDIFGIWVPQSEDQEEDDQEWEQFKAILNEKVLVWEFTERTLKVDYMDMTISIVGNKFETTMYEKPMALHLYIPPHSSHPPGVLTGHVYGEVLRIHRLCTHADDITNRVLVFYRRLLQRGHKTPALLPLFHKALANAQKYLATSRLDRRRKAEAKLQQAKRRVYFHMDYHPQGPRACDVQRLFDSAVLNPPNKLPFNKLGPGETDIPVDTMIVAHHRTLNLDNLFSYRKICKRDGPPVSSFL